MRRTKPRQITITRYYDAAGNRSKKTAPGARKVTEKSETYYAFIKGKGKVSLETTDETQAWVKLRDLLRKESDRAAGIRDDVTDQAGKQFREHLEEWVQSVQDGGASPEQVKLVRLRVFKLAAIAGWNRVTDIDADGCRAALATLQEGDGEKPGISAQTRNHYLTHLKQFVIWCVEGKRLRENPLRKIKKVSVEADRRHDRRVMTDEEIASLLTMTAEGPVRCRMTGVQRVLAYKLSMATGFRAKEIRFLEPSSFDFQEPSVTCRGAYSKNKKPAKMFLPPWLADDLRSWLAAGKPLWNDFPAKHPGRLLQDDLAWACVPYTVTGPDGVTRYADFHSLRHWFVTAMANQPGISPKTLMALTRHSTAQLTMSVYAKAREQDVRAAVESMPAPGTVAKKTGMTDQEIASVRKRIRAKKMSLKDSRQLLDEVLRLRGLPLDREEE